MLASGKLNKRVLFKTRVTGSDQYGEPLDGWQELGTRWASIEPLTGREYFAAHGEVSDISTRLVVRYDRLTATFNTKTVAVYGGLEYNIQSVINPNMKNLELIFMCVSGAADV